MNKLFSFIYIQSEVYWHFDDVLMNGGAYRTTQEDISFVLDVA